MKRGHLKSLVILVLSASIGMVGCTTEEESKPAEEEMAVSTVFVGHKIADYATWRSVYNANEPRRAEAGMKEMGVYRGADDENMVLIVWETADLAAFNARMESPELAEKMKEAGTASKPERWIGGSLHEGAGITFLKHKVADYAAWRPLYDADATRRTESGLQEMGVYRNVDDENMILVVWDAKDGAVVQAMLESEDLAAKMKEAGVLSPPEAWMADANAEMTATKE